MAIPSRLPSLGPLVARVRLAAWLARARPTPEERAQRAALDGARQALRDAEHEHASRIRAKRRELQHAEHEHAAAVRSAQAELSEAERTEQAAIGELERKLTTFTGTRELARYGPFRLYDDRIETGREPIPVVAGLRALVAAGEVVAYARPESSGAARILDPGGHPRRHTTPKPRRTYLVIDAAGSQVLLEAHADPAAEAFAEMVNVAALNADRVARARSGATAELERELSQLRQRRDAAVAEATGKLEAAEADLAAVEAARQALAEAEGDTAEIARRREALASLQQEHEQGRASTPPEAEEPSGQAQ